MSVSVMELYEDEEARESDRDSAIESAAGSELSDGGRGGDKEEGLQMFIPRQSGDLSLNPSVTSDLSTRSLNEEQFEDYGEGDDVDFSPISPEDETHTNGFSDLGSSVPSSATHTPQKVRQLSMEHEVFCSNCCKKVAQLNELETRLKNLKTHSPNRKITSTAFGRQLLYHSNLSSRNGSTEDLFRGGSIDYCDTDIADKVSQLEKKLCELENECLMNSDVQSKLKQENTNLVHRVHELEEQLKEQEARAEQIMDNELRRHRDAFSKLEREKMTQMEILNNRVQQLEVENTEMLASVNRLKTQTEKLDEEKQRVTDKLEDTSLRLKDEMDLYRKMMDKLRQNRTDYQTEREAMQELIEELRRELEHLQLYKLEAERLGRIRRSSVSLSDYTTRTRENDLEQEMKRLKQENMRLREQNEELNGHILSLSLHEAKNLISTQTKAQSLAAEIDSASRDQLMEALKEQEEINIRLRQYMDKIILSILDHNPSILEIKF
ncbi:rab11 family-interacting protein 4B isoform X3 [Tachysurus fulvidraco]|nr:rab11 family-interacting protein 4B isoform X3 [Tachysurus fulvidraco]XP_047669707.1 rab11 family-interacting protein 4B isoform X3 [Tachysurus fulvidraco]XP_047669708.1 rab11 family-interacting protein 4B isoform X3 [Tachysurus fulvidraco]XP_047669709.1 rab11 family-interacting protein 4B isoform X3 [Tachysurus fulvidraco]